MKATFDTAQNLDLYFRKGMNGSKLFRFFEADGDDYDLTGQTFEFRSNFNVTLQVVDNTIVFIFSSATVVRRDIQFWSLVNTTSGQTWLCGNAFFTDTQSNVLTDTNNIVINLTGEVVNVNIQASGDQIQNFRGSFDGSAGVIPETGGTGPNGEPKAGNEWYLISSATINSTTYPVNTIIKFIEDGDGQDFSKVIFFAPQL